jgi:hypothetical protein
MENVMWKNWNVGTKIGTGFCLMRILLGLVGYPMMPDMEKP